VVHLVAEHRHAICHKVCSGCLKVVDAEGEMIEASSSQVRWVRTRIGPWGRYELK
jgi:hypothetical protein